MSSIQRPAAWCDTCWECDPARPVWLPLARALSPSRVGSGTTPLRVRARGVDVSRTLPAVLHTWQQTSTADWFAEVTVRLVAAAGGGEHETVLYTPAAAVAPRERDH